MPIVKEQLLSQTVYDTDGVTTQWEFSFSGGYLDVSHVKAYTLKDGIRTDILVTSGMLVGQFQLQITPAIAAGAELTIYRDTPRNMPLVNFVDRGAVNELTLDTNAKQAVFVSAEVADLVSRTDLAGATEAAEAASTSAAAAASAAAVAGPAATAAAASAAAAAASAATVNPANFATAAQGVKADTAVQPAGLVSANIVDATALGRSILTATTHVGKNKIINGRMDISQRGTSFAAAGTGVYTLDRWVPSYSTTGVVTITQQADAPSDNEFQSSLRVAVTTADTVIGASDNFGLFQNIEGYNIRDLIGKTFTLSFRVRSSKTGVHCVSFRNTGTDRSFVAEYTVNAANTWETKSVTIVGGLPTAGTWNYTNGNGLSIGWGLLCGSAFQTAAGAWQTGNFLATANQVNCLDTVGNIFAITGVQLEAGAVATPFEHRPIGTELNLCQRYFWQGGYGWSGSCINTTNGTVSGTFPVQMRSAPTFAGINGSGGSALLRSGGSAETITSFVNSGADKNGGWFYFGGSAYTAGSPYTVIKDLLTASSEL